MPTTLITGAAGFAGSHLLDLVAGQTRDNAGDKAGNHDGHVVAWHRPGGSPSREVPRARWEAVDMLSRAAVARSIERLRPSIVYHCAGAAHVGRAWEQIEATFAVNVRATAHLLDALAEAGSPSRVVIPSSALVYENANRLLREDDPLVPSGPYGLSKLAQELLGRHVHGPISVVVARAFNHFGPRQDPRFVASGFASRIADIEKGRRKPVISVGNLDAQRDLTDVRDTVRAYRLIAERGVPGRAYNVCSGHAIAIRQLLEQLITRAGVEVELQPDPSRHRPKDLPVILGDPARIRAELGWRPSIPLEQTLDDLLEYWRARNQ
jgi:GDP-4-dehydro-6-deoxy-D-mannose reductase